MRFLFELLCLPTVELEHSTFRHQLSRIQIAAKWSRLPPPLKSATLQKYQLNLSAQETVMQHLNVIPRGQLCEQIGVSRSTIKRWIQTRNFPQPLKASGREPLFNRDAVDQWFLELEAKND